MIKYYCDDIHIKIKKFSDDSIDLIYTSPPYGITTNKWDKGLDWEMLFKEMWRVLKPNGIIILYASCPFTYELLKYEKPKYHYSWIKNNSTGFFKAKQQPLRRVEEIFVYYKKPGTYNPQMEGNNEYPYIYKTQKSSDYFGKTSQNTSDKDIYNYEKGHIGKYPTTYKNWNIRKSKPKSGITRTDEQIDYFIKTYSNENDTILDMTCCNNMVGDRCYKLNRNYIGIDIEFREGNFEEYNKIYS
jgi:site-specific DNA-methyltransferase (adenine-specific)